MDQAKEYLIVSAHKQSDCFIDWCGVEGQLCTHCKFMAEMYGTFTPSPQPQAPVPEVPA